MGLRTGRLDVPLIGYARVSTVDQDLALQRDALHQVGCTRIFEDFGVSGAKTERPALTAALAYIREGDVLVVWKLDRLGRSLAQGNRVKPIKSFLRTAVALWVMSPADLYFCRRVD
jgi:DNA invertase Pin-like site-specific DNA recombinase